MKVAFVAAVAAAVVGAAGATQPPAPPVATLTAQGASPASVQRPPNIAGSWSSVAPEAQGKLYVLRDFEISRTAWRVVYRAFADPDARLPLFSLHVRGFYRIGGSFDAIPGAYRAIFPASAREIVVNSAAGVKMFDAMGCRLEIGKAHALIDAGCGFVPALMDAMGEYDLVAVRRGQLFFGDRTGDLTKARPTALYPFPLRRR